MSIDHRMLKDNFNAYDIHKYEETNAIDEYLVRFVNEFSLQEYQIDGEFLDGFLAKITFDPSITKNVYIYKLVSSYEAIE